MLELKNIKKDYEGIEVVHALKGISLKFRKNEFVSILGQSGCGKTTLLNIIGGLDQYSDGDLLIEGVSTKNYKDRDWDAYRNHSIGFVFQSYNLIPHQTVLQNVELALTLSGVSKKERKERAIEALKQVGLGNQLNKKPNQMSGGQMQRVAIARALVNNPAIILADEPTGALDSQTSVQVMEILKEVAKDRLVIMVTHNPELAQQYSTRIIKMLDGEVIEDSAPFDGIVEVKKEGKVKKPSMKWSTSFSLSLKNLLSKRGRTVLTSFAGSIGIIGIALIFAISQGLTTYINEVQESTLSSYPLTIEKSSVDLSGVMMAFMNIENSDANHDLDNIYSKSSIYEMVDALNNAEKTENDLKAFKDGFEKQQLEDELLNEAVNGVQYSYNFDLHVYTKNIDGDIVYSDTESLLTDMVSKFMAVDMSQMVDSRDNMMSMVSSSSTTQMNLWQELMGAKDGGLVNDVVKKQYDVIYGEWPSAYNEVVLVVDENNELDDLTLFALGLKPQSEIDDILDAAMNQTELETVESKYTYQEICDREYRVVLNGDCYSYDEQSDTYTDLRDNDAGLKYLYDNATPLKVSGIIRQSETSDVGMLRSGIAYTYALSEYVIEQNHDKVAINDQLANENIDIFTKLPFEESTKNLTEKEKREDFIEYIDSLNDDGKANVYVKMKSIPSDEEMNAMLKQATQGQTREQQETLLKQGLQEQMKVNEDDLNEYLASMSDEEFNELFNEALKLTIKQQYAQQVEQQMSMMPTNQLIMALNQELDSTSDEKMSIYYDEIMEFSTSTYEQNLKELGYVDIDEPSAMHIYASSFANKDIIEDAISSYNDGVEEMAKIKYTDYVGLMMSGITSVINAITYILIAFVAISLIVSSIMIGVITLISVQERTKEIGILRAIGASKKEVCNMFNAETLIIGFTSGLLGVIVTIILTFPINAIIHEVTGIMNVNAYLPIPVAIILIVISMILTLIAGIIPSRSAAKKDPVIALRSE